MKASMHQYLRVFVNHQPHALVKWLPIAEFAANDGTSETSICIPCFAIDGVDPRISYSGESTKERDHWTLDADQVQATMQ